MITIESCSTIVTQSGHLNGIRRKKAFLPRAFNHRKNPAKTDPKGRLTNAIGDLSLELERDGEDSVKTYSACSLIIARSREFFYHSKLV